MSASLPIIDISPLRTGSHDPKYNKASGDLYAALSEIGFAIVVGHGVDPQITANMRAAVKAVFDAPRERLQSNMVVKGNYRGFVPLGYFTPNSGKGKPTSTKHGSCITKQMQTTPFALSVIYMARTCGQQLM